MLVYLGKVVNTHGIRGELRIISDFKFKDTVFKINNKIYNANELKGLDVYINKECYKFDGYLDEDLLGLDVYDKNIYKGKIVGIVKSKKYDLLVIDGKKKHMVPNIKEFIESVDLNNKCIHIKYIRGLDNED